MTLHIIKNKIKIKIKDFQSNMYGASTETRVSTETGCVGSGEGIYSLKNAESDFCVNGCTCIWGDV